MGISLLVGGFRGHSSDSIVFVVSVVSVSWCGLGDLMECPLSCTPYNPDDQGVDLKDDSCW